MPLKLTDLPRPLPFSVYEETRRVVVERFKSVEGVRAILEFGTMSLAGLSDFDTFILVDENAPVTFPHMREFSTDQRYVMGGRRQILSKGLFPDLNYFDPWFVEVKTLYGDPETYRFKKIDFGDGYRALSLQFLYQKTVYGSLPLLAEIRKGELPVRIFFGDSVQYGYFLREFKKTGIDYGAEDPGASVYRSFFQGWFEASENERQDRMEKAATMFPESIRWTLRALTKAVSTLPKKPVDAGLRPRSVYQKYLLKRYPGSYIVDTFNRVFVYQKGRTSVGLEVKTVNSGCIGNYECLFILLPLELACFGAVHLSTPGPLSTQYRKCVFTDLNEIPVYDDPQLIRLSEITNRNLAETARVQNGRYYEMLYGYTLRSSTGLKHKLGYVWNDLKKKIIRNAGNSEANIKQLWETSL